MKTLSVHGTISPLLCFSDFPGLSGADPFQWGHISWNLVSCPEQLAVKRKRSKINAFIYYTYKCFIYAHISVDLFQLRHRYFFLFTAPGVEDIFHQITVTWWQFGGNSITPDYLQCQLTHLLDLIPTDDKSCLEFFKIKKINLGHKPKYQ